MGRSGKAGRPKTMSPDRLLERFTEELPFARVRRISLDKVGMMEVQFTTGSQFDYWTIHITCVRAWEDSFANWRSRSGIERTEVA